MQYAKNYSITKIIVTLGFIIIIGVGLRIYNISYNSLSLDEAYTLYLAKKNPLEITSIIAREDNHPPFFYLIMHY